MTGLPCPGCGLTHAAIAVVHGDMGAAIRLNALIFLFPFVAGLVIAERLWSRSDSFRRFCNVFYIIVVTVMFIYFIVRVVLFFPRGPYPMTWDRNNIPNKIVTSIRNISTGPFFKSGD